jgi:hypothetical protein
MGHCLTAVLVHTPPNYQDRRSGASREQLLQALYTQDW